MVAPPPSQFRSGKIYPTSPEFSVFGVIHYYGYRYYHPNLGRWLSRDPIEEQGGLNLYAYVNNDSGNAIDHFGLIIYTTQEEGQEYGQNPLDIDELPKLENCEGIILVGHAGDMPLAVSRIVSNSSKDGFKSCTGIGVVSCIAKRALEDSRNRLRQDNLSKALPTLIDINDSPDGDLENNGPPDQIRPGRNRRDNAADFLNIARKAATDRAKKLCKAKCECPQVKFKIQLIGGYRIGRVFNDTFLWSDKPDPLIMNFGLLEWAPYFKDIVVNCKDSSASESTK